MEQRKGNWRDRDWRDREKSEGADNNGGGVQLTLTVFHGKMAATPIDQWSSSNPEASSLWKLIQNFKLEHISPNRNCAIKASISILQRIHLQSH